MGGDPGNRSGPEGICSKMYGLGLKKAQRSPTRGEQGQVLGGELAAGPGAMGLFQQRMLVMNLELTGFYFSCHGRPQKTKSRGIG